MDVFTGETVQFTDQSTDFPTSWQWRFGDGGSARSQNPSHTYNMLQCGGSIYHILDRC